MILIFLTLIFIDQMSKNWIRNENFPKNKNSCKVVLLHIENQGIAGSLFSQYNEIAKFLNLFGVGCLLLQSLLIKHQHKKIHSLGFTLQLSGAFSNLFDRLTRGSVTDMINFPHAPGKLKKFVFNLADFFVIAGTILEICFNRKK